MRRISIILIVALLCSASECGRRTVVRNQSVTLEPSFVRDYYPSVEIFPANSTYWPCGPFFPTFDTSGTGKVPGLLVGYTRSYKSGTQPFPCDRQNNGIYWFGVQFDLSALKRDPPPFIVSARLSFDKIRLSGDAECEDKVYAATAPLPVDLKSIPLAEEVFELPVPLLSSAGCKGSRCTMEVRGQVDLFVRELMPNHGFVFNPVNTSLYVKENKSCVNEYRNLRLEVDTAFGVLAPVPIRKPGVPIVIPDLKAPPTTAKIVLTVRKIDAPTGRQYQLEWTGAPPGTPLDLYRNGARFATVGSGVAFLDAGAAGSGPVTYQVCVSGAKTTCSDVVPAPL
ncbi:hypothetical protein H9L13_07515 [Sphingomonas lutea]|uniref:Uncharacterized protein n=1 Tax=Sphingomonas lutea TaxID=1045317 RepID=A0A7G9SFD5_9SPHN|nr:hypothetical protein [Sphingomonas lutea]QNN66560.1 hypothetical protein H9L13_07515 [Sphingomonas lutea]